MFGVLTPGLMGPVLALENPTRQQKKDVKELMAILSRMHFKEVLRYTIFLLQLPLSGEQILCKLNLMMSSLSGYVMCIMWLIEALAYWCSLVNE
ncbi:hypothetical protein AB3S75_040673 [Citrus x aurantiifolia]